MNRINHTTPMAVGGRLFSIRITNTVLKRTTYCLVVAFLCGQPLAECLAQSDGLTRLLDQTNAQTPAVDPATAAPSQLFGGAGIQTLPAATLLPSDHFSQMNHRKTNFQKTGFVTRQNGDLQGAVVPMPIGKEGAGQPKNASIDGRIQRASGHAFHPRSTPQEYVFDGSDRAARTHVDQNFNVSGLDTEDTVAHFDTLDGDRIVTPSNRVAIYAPRFGAVRRIDGVVNAQYNQPTVALDKRQQTVQASDQRGTTSTKQYSMSKRTHGGSRASGFIDQTRGVTADSVLRLGASKNYLQTLYGQDVLEIDQLGGALRAQLQTGMQTAVAWETDLGLRVVSKGLQPIIVRDLRSTQELKHIESEDDQPTLRVVKVADKIAARVGEEVEFTIRFDNISARPIGNVTLMDNLTRRLEYVDGSSECSKNSEFISEVNDAGSLLLRWEITDPLEPSTGGVIRFRCRAR